MSRSLLISPCKQLLTLAGPPHPRRGTEQGELGLIHHGGILIEDGLVRAIGAASDVEALSSGKLLKHVQAQGCVVMPGFVDSHSHALFIEAREKDYAMRISGCSYQEIAAQGGGILSSVRGVRAARKDDLVESALGRMGRFLEHGTTTLEIKSGYGLDLENEIKLLEAAQALSSLTPLELVPTFLGAHEVPEEYRMARKDYLSLLIEQMIPLVTQRGLADFCDCFTEPGVFSLEEAEAVLSAALRHGLKLKLHADQLGRSGAALLGIRLRAVSVDHLEHINAEDIRALAQSTTLATLLPGSVFHLGLQTYAPARALIDAGVPVALATDFNPGTSPTANMQMILSLACTQMRMTPAEAIVAATINGAHALCRADLVGSLEPGKQADLCIMEVDDYRQIPYWFGMNHCRMTVKRGEVVYLRQP